MQVLYLSATQKLVLLVFAFALPRKLNSYVIITILTLY